MEKQDFLKKYKFIQTSKDGSVTIFKNNKIIGYGKYVKKANFGILDIYNLNPEVKIKELKTEFKNIH